MMKYSFLSLLFSLMYIQLTAQSTYTLSGNIQDSSSKEPLMSALIGLTKLPDSTKVATISDMEGKFGFENLQPARYLLEIQFLGYKNINRTITISTENINLGIIPLAEDAKTLGEISVVEQILPIRQKGDTTEYNAAAFKVNPDATAEDLVRKMPNITVTNGKVQAQGEDVKQVMVDGKPFFGNDPTATLRNLPADMIENVQVFDLRSDQDRFSGSNSGNTNKTINIVTKASKRNGFFGRAFAGYGYSDTYQKPSGNALSGQIFPHNYQIGGVFNYFKKDRRISVVLQSNNINAQNFSTEDLGMSMTSGGGPGGGGRGGGGGMGGPMGGSMDAFSFLSNQTSGLNTTQALGINYSDKWGKKIDVSGSYFYNFGNNLLYQTRFKNFILPNAAGQTYNEINFTNTKNQNHRINLQLTYQMDSFNSIIIRPRISFQPNQKNASLLGITDKSDVHLSETDNATLNKAFNYSVSNDLTYRLRFRKMGRTFSIGTSFSYNHNYNDNNFNAFNTYFNDSLVNIDTLNQYSKTGKDSWSISPNLVYTEAIDSFSSLQFSYNLNYNNNASNKSTYNVINQNLSNEYMNLDSTLSNNFDNLYASHRPTIEYRYQKPKFNLNVSAAYQWSQLTGNTLFPEIPSVKRTYNNVLPGFFMNIRPNKKHNLRMGYRTSTNVPSVDKLQDLVSNSNPLFISSGNSKLNQEYTHRIFSRYNYTNSEKAFSVFGSASFAYTQNYIGNSTLIASADTTLANGIFLKQGVQYTQPVNINGYMNVMSYGGFNVPIKKIKTNLNTFASVNYTLTPGIINNATNYAHQQNYMLGLVLASNISQNIDFTFSSNSGFNVTNNTLQSSLNTQYFIQNTNARLNVIFLKRMVFATDVTHQYYGGLSASYNQQFFLWNMSIGTKLFKKQQAELKILVYDLLNQNRSIQRTVTESYIDDTKTNMLRRYFMVMFTYTFRKYEAEKPDPNNPNPMNNPHFRQGGGMMPPPR